MTRNRIIRHPRLKDNPTEAIQHIKARHAVAMAIKHGSLPPVRNLRCEVCQGRAKQYHHYKGYAPRFWLTIKAVCVPCHAILHTHERNEQLADAILKQIHNINHEEAELLNLPISKPSPMLLNALRYVRIWNRHRQLAYNDWHKYTTKMIAKIREANNIQLDLYEHEQRDKEAKTKQELEDQRLLTILASHL